MSKKTTNQTHFAVPFCDDETATMYLDKNFPVDVDQTNITYEQAKYLYEDDDCSVEGIDPEILKASIRYIDCKIDGVTLDKTYYGFDHIAIIPMSEYKALKVLEKSLWKMCKGDSSTYDACEAFNDQVKSIATKIIEITTKCEIVQY